MSDRGDRPRSRSRSVSPSKRRQRSSSRGSNDRDRDGVDKNPGNNLFVTRLSYQTSDETLRDVFSKYGEVAKCQIMRDPHSRESRGFGFVTMATHEGALAAIGALNQTELDGKPITVEMARRSRPRTPTPGRYYGPPKKRERERDRGYDRGGRGGYRDDYDRRGSYDRGGYERGGYDRGAPRYPSYDRGGAGGRYDPYERPPTYDRYDGRDYRYDRGGYPPPPVAGYPPVPYDDRRPPERPRSPYY